MMGATEENGGLMFLGGLKIEVRKQRRWVTKGSRLERE